MNSENINCKSALVIGCTGGVGRSITRKLVSAKVAVTGVARNTTLLTELKNQLTSIDIVSADATDPLWADKTMREHQFDYVVLALGATPHMVTIQNQTWETFGRAWDVDMKASFLFCRAAIAKPLKPGSRVIIISGGPALGASPLSGGLSPAKWGQLFLAQISQGQSDRLGLDIRFAAIAPKRVMPGTKMGRVAAQAYANYLGTSIDGFMTSQTDAQSEHDVGSAVYQLLTAQSRECGSRYELTSKGLTPIE